ncbi:50S ribosomal protein L1 [Novilysobacter defluvii]|uniref:Large ribosomal subunit protein uL1 n=1 Tax=Lysobacter defluvii IMMIB APB-9 = DSM 18482 TaxID=1385515 RepID=A0A0A0M5Q9_9GAMM|nr:50S ribosomal protein L1 [Lysobacter defluvii]KGO98348.1 50S ribosomal protein L1 [Lysobacter defluvii IMMIB APB-9 = DSM 18482]
MAMNKRKKAIKAAVVPGKAYAFDEAIQIIKNTARAKFVESVDVAVRLGVDARKSDQQVRGSTVLPAGTGKSVRVAVFAPAGAKADEALAAGADIVGMDDLAEKMQAGDLDYDVVIATPDAMRVVGKLGQLLGPRGLMPNPKVGTVSPNAAEAVKNAKGGQVRYRTDKAGIIHCTIGKIDFEDGKLKENLEALLSDLVKAKPATAKGTYLQKVSISSTMGPGVPVEQASLALAR